MSDRPSDAEMAAIAAAYFCLERARDAPEPPTVPRWRLAGRGFEAEGATDIRAHARGSAWRNAGRPQ